MRGRGPYCPAHYQRDLKGIPLDKPLRLVRTNSKRKSDYCEVEGCDRPFKSNGLCTAHDWRRRNNSPMDVPIRKFDPTRTCRLDGCDRPFQAKGYCQLHYARSMLYPHKMTSPVRRFIKLSDIGNRSDAEDDCTIQAAHRRVSSLWGSASEYLCIACGNEARHWAYDGTDPTQRYGQASSSRSMQYYSRFPEFYMPMCAKCHRIRDSNAAAAELREYREWKNRTGLTLKDLESF